MSTNHQVRFLKNEPSFQNDPTYPDFGEHHLKILRCETTPKNAALLTGEVTGGSLEVLGRLRKGRVRRTGVQGALELGTSEVIDGHCEWDADEDRPDVVYLLRLGACHIIVLTRDDDSFVYPRRGYMDAKFTVDLRT